MTGRAPLPPWQDDLHATLAACWGLLARGVADRRSGFHHPVISSIGLDGLQIRLAGRASLHHDDAVADAAWQASRAMSRVCYGTRPAPGSEIASGDAFALPSPDDAEGLEAGRAHFSAVVMRIESLESLYLAFDGHRRALFAWDAGGALTARWLAP
jgi:hypothetical protein